MSEKLITIAVFIVLGALLGMLIGELGDSIRRALRGEK